MNPIQVIEGNRHDNNRGEEDHNRAAQERQHDDNEGVLNLDRLEEVAVEEPFHGWDEESPDSKP